jgi:5-hydroxyisourate hydrolase
MGKLTTHVLDTARGRPGAGMRVELYALGAGSSADPAPSDPLVRTLVASITTNAEGRADHPLADGDDFAAGTYELVFHAGEYFNSSGLADYPPFLDEIPIRFTVGPDGYYHVPLLVSPWSYTTYRGS